MNINNSRSKGNGSNIFTRSDHIIYNSWVHLQQRQINNSGTLTSVKGYPVQPCAVQYVRPRTHRNSDLICNEQTRSVHARVQAGRRSEIVHSVVTQAHSRAAKIGDHTLSDSCIHVRCDVPVRVSLTLTASNGVCFFAVVDRCARTFLGRSEVVLSRTQKWKSRTS